MTSSTGLSDPAGSLTQCHGTDTARASPRCCGNFLMMKETVRPCLPREGQRYPQSVSPDRKGPGC